MIDLVVNKNSYVTVEDADELLQTSIRTAFKWTNLDSITKQAALLTAFRLIEQQTWQGTRGAYLNVSAATIDDPGTDYEVDNVIAFEGGTVQVAATFSVKEIAGGGLIATLTPLDAGLYVAAPTSPAETSIVIGDTLGTGATLAFSAVAQQAAWPRSGVVDRYGQPLAADVVPELIQRAQILLAYELSQNPTLEVAANTGSNIRGLRAGSVGIDFFAPGLDWRFPSIVQELLLEFLHAPSGGGVAGAFATGTGAPSEFADPRYTLGGPLG